MAPFVVAGKVGLGGIIFLAGRFLVVVVHEFAHGLTVESFGRKVPKAGLKLMLDLPVRVRRHLGGVVRAGPAADRDQRRGADQRPHDRRRGRARDAASAGGTLQDVWFQLALAAYTGAIFNLNPLLDRDGYHILVDLMREPGLRRRSREWLVEPALRPRPAEPDDAGVLATYAVTALVWSLATVGFTVVMSQRYYGYLTALAPASVVWTVLIGLSTC